MAKDKNVFDVLTIAWDCGPHDIKEEFLMFSSQYMKDSILGNKEQSRQLNKISSKSYIDFIPDSVFMSNNVSTRTGTIEEIIDEIIDAVSFQDYSIKLGYLEIFESAYDAAICLFLQGLFIELLYNNHNIDLFLSKKTTSMVIKKIAKRFDINTKDVYEYFCMLSDYLIYDEDADDSERYKCVVSVENKNGICNIVMSSKQSICRVRSLYFR